MELNDFKDRLFDVLNESDELNISDIAGDDAKNIFVIEMEDRSVFVIECHKVLNFYKL